MRIRVSDISMGAGLLGLLTGLEVATIHAIEYVHDLTDLQQYALDIMPNITKKQALDLAYNGYIRISNGPFVPMTKYYASLIALDVILAGAGLGLLMYGMKRYKKEIFPGIEEKPKMEESLNIPPVN